MENSGNIDDNPGKAVNTGSIDEKASSIEQPTVEGTEEFKPKATDSNDQHTENIEDGTTTEDNDAKSPDKRSMKDQILNRLFYGVLALILALGLYLYYEFLLQTDQNYTIILFIVSTLSVVSTTYVWKKFTKNLAYKIIYLTSEHKIGRKIIAGGSFSYYEYNPNIDKISPLSPIGKFVTLLIAFLGMAVTLVKISLSLPFIENFDSPLASPVSVTIWSILIIFVPILLTPIIPIIWTMQDLGLKAWNSKKRSNWAVADKYRAKFNSFIAISAIASGTALSKDPSGEFVNNLIIFVQLIGQGSVVLIYPLALLTAVYFMVFYGEVSSQVMDRLNLPTARTDLIYNTELFDHFISAIEDEMMSTEEIVAKAKEILKSDEKFIDSVNEHKKRMEKVEKINQKKLEQKKIKEEIAVIKAQKEEEKRLLKEQKAAEKELQKLKKEKERAEKGSFAENLKTKTSSGLSAIKGKTSSSLSSLKEKVKVTTASAKSKVSEIKQKRSRKEEKTTDDSENHSTKSSDEAKSSDETKSPDEAQ